MEIVHKLTRFLSWRWYQSGVTARRFLWDAAKSRSLEALLHNGCLYSQRLPPALPGDDPIFDDPNLKLNLQALDVSAEREEYLYRLQGKFVVEPRFGYVLLKPFTLIDLALPGSPMVRDPKARPYFSGIPPFINTLKGKPVVKAPSVITFHFVFDSNYYHFYQDVMTRLKLLADYGIDQNIPILVSSRLASQPFFGEITRRGALANRKWIVQGDFYVEAEEIIFAKCDVGNRERLDFFLDSFEGAEANPAQSRRIFLTRALHRGRTLLNLDLIRPILEQFGFEEIDTAKMTVEEQMTLFSEAGSVIGLHGAGLTNMIYRRNGSLKLLEIFPPAETSLHYYILSKLYNFEYDYLIGTGEETSRHAPFYVDPVLLRAKLEQMFQPA